MRIKIQHKMQLPYENTVLGLKKLLEKLEENKIPDDADVYFRGFRTVECMWSSLDE